MLFRDLFADEEVKYHQDAALDEVGKVIIFRALVVELVILVCAGPGKVFCGRWEGFFSVSETYSLPL